MVKKHLAKAIAVTMIVTSVLALNPTGVSASWKQDNSGWWYTEGNSWVTGWRNIDKKWYYFYPNGYMAHNTVRDNYYINGNGEGIELTNKDLPIKIPSNWAKVTDKAYATPNGSVFVCDVRSSFGGSESAIIQGMKEGIINKASDLKTIEKNYSGHNATCLEYLYNYDGSTTKKTYMVIMFSNEKVYAFIMTSNIENYEEDKRQLEDMLNLTLTL